MTCSIPPVRSVTTVLTIAMMLMVTAGHASGDDAAGAVQVKDINLDASGPRYDSPASDRLWTISTRSITHDICRASLSQPSLEVHRLGCDGHTSMATMDDYMGSAGHSRQVVIYVHGNRLDSRGALKRGLSVYKDTLRNRHSAEPIDWVIWSWPSTKQGILVHDARRKAVRLDTQGLYLSWMLSKHAELSVPTTLIGYSFGSRVVTGALHALAGGTLGGRSLPGPAITGMNFDAGLVAPAIERDWMSRRGYHSYASKNIDRMLLLYNRRDAVLKRYWRLDRVHGSVALGYSGLPAFALRADGTKLSVRSRDCARFLGLHHSELDYYRKSCNAGSEMAALIDDIDTTH